MDILFIFHHHNLQALKIFFTMNIECTKWYWYLQPEGEKKMIQSQVPLEIMLFFVYVIRTLSSKGHSQSVNRNEPRKEYV